MAIEMVTRQNPGRPGTHRSVSKDGVYLYLGGRAYRRGETAWIPLGEECTQRTAKVRFEKDAAENPAPSVLVAARRAAADAKARLDAQANAVGIRVFDVASSHVRPVDEFGYEVHSADVRFARTVSARQVSPYSSAPRVVCVVDWESAFSVDLAGNSVRAERKDATRPEVIESFALADAEWEEAADDEPFEDVLAREMKTIRLFSRIYREAIVDALRLATAVTALEWRWRTVALKIEHVNVASTRREDDSRDGGRDRQRDAESAP